jgi:hypothetical protein
LILERTSEARGVNHGDRRKMESRTMWAIGTVLFVIAIVFYVVATS